MVLQETIFDLTNLEYWEHLLVAEPWHSYSEKLCDDEKINANALKHFTMPSSWVPKLTLPVRSESSLYILRRIYEAFDCDLNLDII